MQATEEIIEAFIQMSYNDDWPFGKPVGISYNITEGGEGQLGNHLSEEARRKIGEKNREHYKGYISRKCVEAGRLYNLGRKHSKERIEKMR